MIVVNTEFVPGYETVEIKGMVQGNRGCGERHRVVPRLAPGLAVVRTF